MAGSGRVQSQPGRHWPTIRNLQPNKYVYGKKALTTLYCMFVFSKGERFQNTLTHMCYFVICYIEYENTKLTRGSNVWLDQEAHNVLKLKCSRKKKRLSTCFPPLKRSPPPPGSVQKKIDFLSWMAGRVYSKNPLISSLGWMAGRVYSRKPSYKSLGWMAGRVYSRKPSNKSLVGWLAGCTAENPLINYLGLMAGRVYSRKPYYKFLGLDG